MHVNKNEYLFVEKYRPKFIDDLIITNDIKKNLKKWKQDGEIPNLLLTGRTPGTGKTSIAHTIINELDAEALFLNASLQRNIDVLKDKIQGFVSTASFDDRPKIVVLDEADFLNAQSTQPALRGFIENFSKSARFILTANYPEKIIEPLRNRLIQINFDEMFNVNKEDLIKQVYLRVIKVLDNEGIKYNKKDVIWLVKHYYPSTRGILNKIQEFSQTGELVIDKQAIDIDSLNTEIFNSIINKDFDTLLRSISKLSDPGSIFSTLYDRIDDFPKNKRPQIIITIAKYAANDAIVRDRLINAVACGTEVLETLEN